MRTLCRSVLIAFLLGPAGRATAADGASRQAPAPVSPEARAAIGASITRIGSAVNARDMDSILEECAPDSLLRREIRDDLGRGFPLDSLRFAARLDTVLARGDTMDAVVCEDASWSEYGRRQADVTYRTYGFSRIDGRWRLTSARPRDFARARRTDLAIDLHPGEGRLSGRARLTIGFSAAGEHRIALALNRGLTIRRIEGPDGRPQPFTRTGAVLLLPLHRPAAAGDSIAFTIVFDGSLFNEAREQGYSQVGVAPGGCFASWVTDWYPHVYGTGSKSRGTISFSAPAGMTVACSGRPVASAGVGNPPRQVFRVDVPLDFSFAAARYFHRSRTVDGVDLGVYFLEGGGAKADLYISSCARVIAFLHDLYGFYPFDGYSIVEVPSEAVGSLGGSSEQGMNIFPAGGLPDSTFPLPLLAHEIGHGWWGNLVRSDGTPVIDEGLAQMTSLLCVEHLQGTAAMRRFLRRGFPDYGQSAAMYFRVFAPARDLPLATRPADAAQTMTAHDLADTKGFFVYEMLRETIGDDAFTRGLRAAVTRFRDGQIRLADLERIWSEQSGRDLRPFFHQWFERTGAPELTMTTSIGPAPGGGFDVRGIVAQTGELYDVTADVVAMAAGRRLRTESVHLAETRTPFAFHTTVEPDTVVLDPDGRILRWTPGLRNLELLEQVRGLRQAGARDSARARLAEYLDRVPGGTAGRVERGWLDLDSGDTEGAEREFLGVIRQAGRVDSTDAAVPRAETALGIIADLRHRRGEAIAWYRRALASTETGNWRAEAAGYLAHPCDSLRVARLPAQGLLEKCVGTYSAETGMRLVVAIGAGGVLSAATGGGTPFMLTYDGGTRFRPVEATDSELEFSGAGAKFDDVSIRFGARRFELRRQ